MDAVWANEIFAQLGESGLDGKLTPEERLRVLKKLRALLRLHQEERLKRWSKAWAWGSDQEVAAAINEMIKKNAIVHEDAKEDTEAQPTLHDLMRDFLTQADAVRQALAVETRGLEQRVEELLRAQRHGGGHDLSAVEMDNEDAGPPALDISSSDEEQGRKDEGRVKRHSRAERRRRVRENARESISDRTHHLCGRKPQNGKAGCVCRTCHFDRRENATKEREPPVLPLSLMIRLTIRPHTGGESPRVSRIQPAANQSSAEERTKRARPMMNARPTRKGTEPKARVFGDSHRTRAPATCDSRQKCVGYFDSTKSDKSMSHCHALRLRNSYSATKYRRKGCLKE